MATVRKIWAFVRRDFVQTVSYRMNFAVMLFGIMLSSLTFFFFSRLIERGSVPALEPYGGEYFPFALLGIAFYSFIGVGLQSLADSIGRAQTTGTLEALLVTPTPITVVIFASTLFAFMFAAVRVVLYLFFGVLLFGVSLGNANLPAALVVLVLSVATFTAMGMLSASWVMVFKTGGSPTGWVFGGVSTLFGGVIFPVETLPSWLQPVSKILPITYALEAMRRTVLTGAGLGEILDQLGMLLAFGVVLLPLGVLAFSLAIRRAKRIGSLVQY